MDFCEFSKNTFFREHLWTTASHWLEDSNDICSKMIFVENCSIAPLIWSLSACWWCNISRWRGWGYHAFRFQVQLCIYKLVMKIFLKWRMDFWFHSILDQFRNTSVLRSRLIPKLFYTKLRCYNIDFSALMCCFIVFILIWWLSTKFTKTIIK